MDDNFSVWREGEEEEGENACIMSFGWEGKKEEGKLIFSSLGIDRQVGDETVWQKLGILILGGYVLISMLLFI